MKGGYRIDRSPGWRFPFPVERNVLKISARMPSAECQHAGSCHLGGRRSWSVTSCHPLGRKCHLLRLFLDQWRGWAGAMSEAHMGHCWDGLKMGFRPRTLREGDPRVFKRPFLAKVTSPSWRNMSRCISPDLQVDISDVKGCQKPFLVRGRKVANGRPRV